MNLNLETERLYIRPLMIKDVDFILQLLNSKGWIQFIGDRNVKDIKAANDYIQRILLNNKFFYSVFEIKETNTPIGIVTFLYRENKNYPDIGFAMLPEYEKKGYAFEAANNYLIKIIKSCNYPNSLMDKEKAIISDGLSSFAPLFDERCNYNRMIEFVTIKNLLLK